MLVTPALALSLAAALGWSTYDLLRKLLTGRVAALPLVALITLGALLPLAAWTAFVGDWRIGSGYVLPGLASVALNVAANLAFFRSLQLAPMSVTLPLLSLTPVFTAVLALLLLGESLGGRQVAGIALVVVGALAINLQPGEGLLPRTLIRAALRERGSQLMAFVALCWSATLLLDKRALLHAAPTLHAFVLHAGVAAGALAMLAARRELATLKVPAGVLGLLVATVLCGAVTVTVQLMAIQSMAVALVETLKRGVGATLALVWGRAFFGEPLPLHRVVAVATMVGGVVLLLA
ncbi:MAG: EamA family transporter [Holophagales bacterium]|nr:MAG: EamA family transporter [Holophagales bacterium]